MSASLFGGSDASAVDKPIALNGDTFRIEQTDYRFADVIAPAIQTGEIYARQAQAIAGKILKRGIDEIREVAPPDRWGRKIVIPSRITSNGEKVSLQTELVRMGALRVKPESDEIGFIERLLKIEHQARAFKIGLWGTPSFSIWDALHARDAVGAFHLIEGLIEKTASRKARTYLNFGTDYKTDFTATLKSGLARRWREAGFDVLLLEKKQVRVRGFVEWINGPSISLYHPAQIEQLS